MESLESLATVDLFKYVKREGLERLMAEMHLLFFPEGPIIKENDLPDGLYIIKSGMVRVSKAAGTGEIEAVLAILRPGNTFGELSLLDGEPRSASVTAYNPWSATSLDGRPFSARSRSIRTSPWPCSPA